MGAALKKWLHKEPVAGWLFLLPVLVGLGIFMYGALVYSLFISMTRWDLLTAPEWVGLANFRRLFTDPNFRQALSNTLFFVITMVPGGIIASFTLAVLLHRSLRGIAFFRAAYYMPHITSSIAIGMVWLWIFNPDLGVLNTILRAVGIADPPYWFDSVLWAKPALLIVRIWQVSGYYMILYIAALQTIPDDLYEAASIDGASAWQRIRHITIPLLSNTTFFVTIMLIIESFNIFEIVYVMTEGGPGGTTNTILYHIYTQAFESYRMGYSAAMAWVLFLMIFVLTLIQFLIRRKRERDQL